MQSLGLCSQRGKRCHAPLPSPCPPTQLVHRPLVVGALPRPAQHRDLEGVVGRGVGQLGTQVCQVGGAGRWFGRTGLWDLRGRQGKAGRRQASKCNATRNDKQRLAGRSTTCVLLCLTTHRCCSKTGSRLGTPLLRCPRCARASVHSTRGRCRKGKQSARWRYPRHRELQTGPGNAVPPSFLPWPPRHATP